MAFSLGVAVAVLAGLLLLTMIFLNCFWKRREQRMLVRALSEGSHFGSMRAPPRAVEVSMTSMRATDAAAVPVASEVSDTTLMDQAEPIDASSVIPSVPSIPWEAQESTPPRNQPPPEPSDPPPPPSPTTTTMPGRRPSTAERVSFLEQMHSEGKISEHDFQAAMQDISSNETTEGELACT